MPQTHHQQTCPLFHLFHPKVQLINACPYTNEHIQLGKHKCKLLRPLHRSTISSSKISILPINMQADEPAFHPEFLRLSTP